MPQDTQLDLDFSLFVCPDAREETDTAYTMMLPEGDIKKSPTPKMSLKAGRSEMLEQVTQVPRMLHNVAPN